ncbi:MAG: ferrochelatase [Candidatus Binatia bacterium]
MSVFDSVLLIGFGGPEKPEAIRPFLQILTEGRRIPKKRVEQVAHHYEIIGGRSPFNDLTYRQADGLRHVLKRDGIRQPVFVGMRNWHPFLYEMLVRMKDQGHRRALGIILSAFQTEASWGRYIAAVDAARGEVGRGAPEVIYAPAWGGHPLFIEAEADRVASALAGVASDRRKGTPLIFTAHSIPAAMAVGSRYIAQLTAAAHAVAERLGHRRWSVAYQSRSGSPREAWLGPEICDVLRELASSGLEDVVVVPIGFVCEHVEVLYDLDVEARQVAEELGLRFHRAATANDHPSFIEMLADLVREGLAR